MKNRRPKSGTVYLVGAGPGDPGLLTLHGAERLRSADAVVYDALTNPSLLELAGQAEKIYAGKNIKSRAHRGAASHKYIDQDFTNRILVKLARQGKNVVRLKGGDPFIFGRGGEEASYIKKAGIPFEVIPGVSAGYAAPAYAGIPVTDRRLASLVVFVTAHENPGKPETAVDWKSLAGIRGTLVIFMGLKNMAAITRKLMDYGRSSREPVSVIERGTFPQQKVCTGTLSDIASRIQREKINSPAVTVIGEVNRLRKDLDWFKRPLSGKTVLVTRARSQAGTLKMLLEQKGAEVIEYPVIDIQPPQNWKTVDETIRNFSAFDWVVFTSTNGVESFLGRVKFLKKDARIFSGKKIAVIGEATAEALAVFGLRADLIPETFTSQGLLEAFRRIPLKGKSILLARTDIAPAFLRESLRKRGAAVRDLTVYRTVPQISVKRKKELVKWIGERKIDFVTFTSSSTVKHFLDPLPLSARRKLRGKLASIGPVTSQTLKEYGLKPSREAKVHTIPGLVEALAQ